MSSSSQRSAAALVRIAALAALVSLSACGGGSSSPGPTLTASAASTSATAGGQSVALTAVAANSTDTVTWSLSGPGSLSATTGATVDYIPPAPDALNAGTQATITATLGTLTQTVVLNVATAPGSNWEMTQVPSEDVAAVVQANGSYVAVGSRGVAQFSADGKNWTSVDTGANTDLYAVAYGSAGYVAVGNSGAVVSSADGKTWTTQPRLPVSGGILEGIAYGHGLYVVPGANGVFTSADGVTWTLVPVFTRQMSGGGIAIANGRFVMATTAGTAWSDDGVSWTLAPSAPAFCDQLTYGNGLFVSSGNAGISTSADGITWSSPVVVGAIDVYGLGFTNGHFFVATENLLSTSTDGRTWTTGSYPSLVDSTQWANAFTTTPSGDVLMLGTYGLAATSSDLVTWTPVGQSDHGDSWFQAAYANGTFVALDDNGRTWNSTDGRGWAAGTLSDPDGVEFLVAANGRFFVGDDAGNLRTSPDGVTWTTQTPGLANRLFGVAWGNGLYVAVGDGGIATSPDGSTWTVVSTSTSSDPGYAAVAYGAGLFVASDTSQHVLTSPDGVHWTTGTTDFGEIVDGIAYGPSGFVAKTFLETWHSADGLSWTKGTLPANERPPRGAVVYADGRYVGVGVKDHVLTSVDGVTWTAQALGLPWSLYSVAFDGTRLVAVGDRGEVFVSTH
ncbi:MAG: hypothetical protein ACTHL8_13700 [Burkholderiaceae bacterium]